MKPANWVQGFLNKHYHIEPSENSLVQLFLFYFTVISAFYTVSLAVSETLFISRFTTAELKVLLPWIYISIAIVTILISWIYDHFINYISRVKAILYADAIFIVTIFLLKYLIDIPHIGSWCFFLLLVLLEVFALFKIILFFSLMGDYFSSHHAKRLYGYIINGMALGSIIGGFIVAALSDYTKITNILYVCILILGLTSITVLKISTISILKQSKISSVTESPIRLSIIFKNNYIKLLFMLTILIAIVGVMADYTMLLAASKVLNENELANFFGKFFSYIGIGQLALEIFLGTWLINKLGLQRILFILPLCIIVACLSYFYSPILFFAAAINFVYLTFTETIDLSARQMLFLLLPTRVRVRSQGISDGIIASLGKILGGVIILLFSLFHFHIVFFAELIFLVSLVWIACLLIITPRYKKALSQSVMKPFLFAFEVISGINRENKKTLKLDNVSATLINSLQNIDSEKQKLIISIIPKNAFYRYKLNISKLFSSSHESVVKQLLLKFGQYGSKSDIPQIESLILDHRTAVRAAAILAYANIRRKDALTTIQQYFTDVSEVVQCAAITASYKYGKTKGKALAKIEIKKLLHLYPRMAAKLIGSINIKSLYPEMNELLLSSKYSVKREAVLACQKAPNHLFLYNLTQLLQAEKNLQPEIMQAMSNMPLSASNKIHALYDDENLPLNTRRIILQVMSRRGDSHALDCILSELSKRRYAMTLLTCYQSIKLYPENTIIKSTHKKAIRQLLDELSVEINLQIKIYCQLGTIPEGKRIFFRDTIYFYQVIYFSLLGILYGFKEIDEMASLYSGREIQLSQAEAHDVLTTIAPDEIVQQVSMLKLPPETEINFSPGGISQELLKAMTALSVWHKCLASLCQQDLPINEVQIGVMTMNEEESQLLNKLFIVSILKKAEIFKDIPANELLVFADIAQENIYYAGETLFKEGDHGDCLYLIITGSVRIHSNERDIAILGASECIGELSLLDRLPRSATATIISESHILKLNADDFLNLIAIYPDISRRLLKILSLRLRTTTESWMTK